MKVFLITLKTGEIRKVISCNIYYACLSVDQTLKTIKHWTKQ